MMFGFEILEYEILGPVEVVCNFSSSAVNLVVMALRCFSAISMNVLPET